METVTVQKQSRFKRISGGFKSAFGKRKKIAILSLMFALLAITGYMNFTLNNDEGTVGGDIANSNLFVMFRQERDSDQAADLLMLDSIIFSTGTAYSDEEKANAKTAKEQLQATMAFESDAERQIRLIEQYGDVVVTRGEDNVNVFIKHTAEIDETQAWKIQDIVQGIDQSLDIANIFVKVME